MNSPHDPRAVRDALGSFVTGVTIVTTRDAAGIDVGLTANSFNSVSLDPPMVLWSLALNSGNLPAFRQAQWWAVHILATEQEALSGRFARKDIDRFAGLTLGRGPGDIPLLEGCAARFICRTAYEYEGGDHAIFVGEVQEFDRAGRPPLVYHQGQYGQVLPGSALASATDAEDFSRHFLGHQLGRAYVALFGEVRHEYRSRGLSSADYVVLTALGLGEARPTADLLARARGLGADAPEAALRDTAASGLVTIEGESVHLSAAGRTIRVELTAVAQASQMRVEDRLSPSEIAMLRHLLARIEAPADTVSAA